MDDPLPYSTFLLNNFVNPFSVEILVNLIVIIILLVCSALISGSEVALFSLNPSDLEKIKDAEDKNSTDITTVLSKPKYLLATILIANNAVNIAIIILSTLTIHLQFNISILPDWLDFAIQVIGITFIILLFGEILPKVYATKNALKISLIMALPLKILIKIFSPISFLLIHSTNFLDKKIKRKTHDISVEELSHAIDLTNDINSNQQEHQLLKGIVKFGETSVKEVMTARVNVVSIEKNTPFNEVIKVILDSGHSRIPVYEESFDKVIGILYIKDIIPYINKDVFDWVSLLRTPFFIPENKKLDDLLKEFQGKKIHLAIIVDEYGGTSGIISLEDIIEEIVGEISDEFDTEDIIYSKLDESTYIFDGNTTINDLAKIIILEDNTIFSEMKKEAETLAGLIIEVSGKIPQKNERVNFHNFSFIIEASDKRRIKRVKLVINK